MAEKEAGAAKEKEGAEEAAPKPARKIPLLAIFGALVVVQAGLSFLVLSQKVKPQLQAASHEAGAGDAHAAAASAGGGEKGHASGDHGEAAHPGPLITMEPVVLNLLGGAQERPAFVKLGLALEIGDPKQAAHFSDAIPLVNDAVIRVLGTRTVAEVLDPEGKEKLRADLLAALRAKLGSGTIANVYFTSFVVQ